MAKLLVSQPTAVHSVSDTKFTQLRANSSCAQTACNSKFVSRTSFQQYTAGANNQKKNLEISTKVGLTDSECYSTIVTRIKI